jgi:hypothetical protein
MEYKPTRQSRSDLPIGYQKNCLVVLMCNPSRVYAFWKVPEAGKSLVLRCSGTAGSGPEEELVGITELMPGQEVGSAYLEVPDGVRLRLEWGEWSDGDFQAQLISNTLLLPEWNPNSAPQEGECQAVMVGYARRFSARC